MFTDIDSFAHAFNSVYVFADIANTPERRQKGLCREFHADTHRDLQCLVCADLGFYLPQHSRFKVDKRFTLSSTAAHIQPVCKKEL